MTNRQLMIICCFVCWAIGAWSLLDAPDIALTAFGVMLVAGITGRQIEINNQRGY